MTKIVLMEKNHLSDVYTIEEECISHPWSYALFEAELFQECSICLVAEEDEKVCGFICARDISGEVEIDEIAISEPFRRRGIAKKLIDSVFSHAKKSGAYAANLEVRRSNAAAIALYNSLGFKHVGERKRYYPDNGEDAILMTMRW